MSLDKINIYKTFQIKDRSQREGLSLVSLTHSVDTLKCCEIRSGSVSGATLPMKMREF